MTDAISNALELASDLMDDEILLAMVIDLADAYWPISLRWSDERYCMAKWRGMYISYFVALLKAAGASRWLMLL